MLYAYYVSISTQYIKYMIGKPGRGGRGVRYSESKIRRMVKSSTEVLKDS